MVLMSFALLVSLFMVDSFRIVRKDSTGILVGETDSVESNLTTINEVPRDSSWYKNFGGDGGDHLKRLFKEMAFAKFSLPGSRLPFQGFNGGMALDVIKTLAGMKNPFVGLGVGLIVGIFTPQDSNLALIRTILSHVNRMIDLKLDEQGVKDRQDWLAGISQELRWANRDSQWDIAIGKFNNAKMFSRDCVANPGGRNCASYQLTNGGKKFAQELYYITMAASVWTEVRRKGWGPEAHRMAEIVWQGVTILDRHWDRFRPWRMEGGRFGPNTGLYWGNEDGYCCYQPGWDKVTDKHIVDHSCPGLEEDFGKPPIRYINHSTKTRLVFCAKGWQSHWPTLLARCRSEYMNRIKRNLDNLGDIVEAMKEFSARLDRDYSFSTQTLSNLSIHMK